jgi:hypothetical protein
MKGMSICEAFYELLTTCLRGKVSYLKNVRLSFCSEGIYIFAFLLRWSLEALRISALYLYHSIWKWRIPHRRKLFDSQFQNVKRYSISELIFTILLAIIIWTLLHFFFLVRTPFLTEGQGTPNNRGFHHAS